MDCSSPLRSASPCIASSTAVGQCPLPGAAMSARMAPRVQLLPPEDIRTSVLLLYSSASFLPLLSILPRTPRGSGKTARSYQYIVRYVVARGLPTGSTRTRTVACFAADAACFPLLGAATLAWWGRAAATARSAVLKCSYYLVCMYCQARPATKWTKASVSVLFYGELLIPHPPSSKHARHTRRERTCR